MQAGVPDFRYEPEQAMKDFFGPQISASGAQCIIYGTWGRHGPGDAGQSMEWIYPDFPTMNDLLHDGFLEYTSYMNQQGVSCTYAPAGLAFRKVYDETPGNKMDASSAFSQLYDGAAAGQVDPGGHPSPQGTFLAGCEIFIAIYRKECDVPSNMFQDDIPPETLDYLKHVAAAVAYATGLLTMATLPPLPLTPTPLSGCVVDVPGEPCTDCLTCVDDNGKFSPALSLFPLSAGCAANSSWATSGPQFWVQNTPTLDVSRPGAPATTPAMVPPVLLPSPPSPSSSVLPIPMSPTAPGAAPGVVPASLPGVSPSGAPTTSPAVVPAVVPPSSPSLSVLPASTPPTAPGAAPGVVP
eukprot:gene12210-2226_t